MAHCRLRVLPPQQKNIQSNEVPLKTLLFIVGQMVIIGGALLLSTQDKFVSVLPMDFGPAILLALSEILWLPLFFQLSTVRQPDGVSENVVIVHR